ncbi:MAG: hypothetical protein CVV05_01570 [Gammaproteobacteria bacterium HGW-Gammaproteobacteria-1]|jgi:hypothetical protein|nr:MAG: hypothetical protein CVV05_01570 [Gammaproteobacteria bacterium HGW-Gammaproteobacteria-1]
MADSDVQGIEIEYLRYMANEFISLFRGEGETRNAKLQDALRRAHSLTNGVEQLAGAMKRAAPHLYAERTG